jgi:hypothetical protein
MPLASATYYADSLPATDTVLYTVPPAQIGHMRIGLANRDRVNPRYFNIEIKRASTGKQVSISGANSRLAPSGTAMCPMAGIGLQLSAGDEIHGWGDSDVECLISGALE